MIYLLAEKESNRLLFPVLDQWMINLWVQGMKFQWLDFEVYIKLEDKEVVGTLRIEYLIKFNLSQPSKCLESCFL